MQIDSNKQCTLYMAECISEWEDMEYKPPCSLTIYLSYDYFLQARGGHDLLDLRSIFLKVIGRTPSVQTILSISWNRFIESNTCKNPHGFTK